MNNAQEKPPELLPCPFSHHFDQLRLAQSQPDPYVSDETDGEWAVCRVCGGSTRRYYRRDMAVRAWNTRSVPAGAERVAELEASLAHALSCSGTPGDCEDCKEAEGYVRNLN